VRIVAFATNVRVTPPWCGARCHAWACAKVPASRDDTEPMLVGRLM
jgi:hypothetical protein